MHWEGDAVDGTVARVELDSQANEMLMDSINFSSYRSGRSFGYHGGHAKRSPVLLPASHAGRWHIVVDLDVGRTQASRSSEQS